MRYNRHSIRLHGYDYSQAGAYFVTICARNWQCLFGDIVHGEMVLNKYGKVVADQWRKTAEIRREIELDEWIVMPNHFHGIVWICTDIRRGDQPVAPTVAGPTPRSLGALIAGFKSAVTKRINGLRGTLGTKLWQRNYYEHIIRNIDELNHIREYILNNPRKWDMDRENPVRITNRRVSA